MRAATCTLLTAAAFGLFACGSNPPAANAHPPPPPGPPPGPALPGAPRNLHAVRAPQIVDLFWDPVAGATSYLISGRLPEPGSPAQSLGEVSSNAVQIIFTSVDFALELSITAKSPAGLGGSAAMLVPLPPSLDVHVLHGVSASLTWSADPAYGTATLIGRGPDVATISTLDSVVGAAYLDESGTTSTTYSYEVRLEHGPLVGLSNVVDVRTGLPAPTNVVATALQNHVRLDWTPVPGAVFYQAFYETGPGSGFSSGGALPTDTVQVLPGQRVSATVVALDDRGIPGISSSPVLGRSLPPTPFPSETSQIGKATFSWPPLVDADLVVIDRSEDNGATFVEVARTAGTAFVDDTPPLWTSLLYRFRALDTTVDVSSVPVLLFAFVTETPDQANLGPGTEVDPLAVTTLALPGQSFTVGRAGQLMGIEVKNKGVGSFVLTLRDGDAILASGIRVNLFSSDVPAPIPLSADLVRGNYFDLSNLAIFVSPGEKLRFELEGDEVASETADLTANGALTMLGAADDAHDLVFKTFVRTTADLSAPSVIFSEGGTGAVELVWKGSPAADHYDVLVSQSDGSSTVARTTHDTAATIDGLSPGPATTFVIRAIAADGSIADSAPVVATTLPFVVDQANLADAFVDPINALWFVSTNTGVSFPSTQTFTVGRDGQLASVELAVEGNSDLRVEVLDATNQVLGAAVLAGPHPLAAAEPLSLTQAHEGFVDLAALGIQVKAGQQLGLRLSTPGSLALRNCACTLPGATLFDSSGFPVQNRTLAFKTFLMP